MNDYNKYIIYMYHIKKKIKYLFSVYNNNNNSNNNTFTVFIM